jgi:hypothetical protein
MGAQSLAQEMGLYVALGYTGSISNMRRSFYIAQTGQPATTTLSNNDLEYLYLGGKGYTGSLFDRRSANNLANAGQGNAVTVNPLTQGPSPVISVWAADPAWPPPADNATIASWRAVGSGAGNLVNLGGTDMPLYKLADPKMNNKPSVIFDGVDDVLGFDIATFAQPFWLILMGWMTAPPVSTSNMLGVANTVTIGWSFAAVRWFATAGTVLFNNIAGSANANAHFWLMQANGASGQLVVDGNTASGPVGAGSATEFHLGSGGTLAAPATWIAGGVSFAALYTTDPRLDPKWPIIQQLARSYGVSI